MKLKHIELQYLFLNTTLKDNTRSVRLVYFRTTNLSFVPIYERECFILMLNKRIAQDIQVIGHEKYESN